MAFEWVAGLFQGDNQQTRGLSRDQSNGVALDNANPYYNYRLKRHATEGDLIADPSLLWYTSPYVKRRSGLGTHVGAEVGEGTANYTDVLVVVSIEDWPRASAEWQAGATAVLQREFEQFCRRENFTRLHGHRPLGVKIVEDGGQAMLGQHLKLARGEFVTGLLPNLYTGPVRGSYPVIGVHLNLPGVWDGYREVGRMYNDQILFTVGNHWLDNFHHPSLQQAALYRLRQYTDGSFLHIVNPDLQDQFQVTSTNQGGGASVLTLATRTGQPLAYMVLAVIDPPKMPLPGQGPGAGNAIVTPLPAGAAPAWGGSSQPPFPAARRPGIQMPTPTPAPPRGPGQAPMIAPPMMLEESRPSSLGGKTIIPDAPSERIFTLQERGALLQKVHFAAFMLGYDVYLGLRGELGTNVEDAAATFQVRKRSVQLLAHIDSVLIDGRPVPAGVEVPLEGDVTIEVAGQRLEYRDLRAVTLEGWPYVAEIRRPASSTYMMWGEEYHIGRSRECRVVLPDEPRNDNIHWKPAVGDGATIRARSGEIPKSRFYTDSIMVASEHASVSLVGERPRIVCSARHCYVYVRRAGQIFGLYPASSEIGPKDLDLDTGDEVLIGNCLFHVSYNAGDLAVPAPAPMVFGGSAPRSADRLVADVAAPNLQMLDRDTGPPAPPRTGTPVGGPSRSAPAGLQGAGRPWEIDGANHRAISPSDVPSREAPPPVPARGPVMDSIVGAGRWPTEQTAPVAVGAPRAAHALEDDADDLVLPDPSTGPIRDVAGWDVPDWDQPRQNGVSPGGVSPGSNGSTAGGSLPRVNGASAAINLPGLNAGIPDPFLSPLTAEPRGAPPPRLAPGAAVVAVDEAQAQIELGRELHLVLVGWVVNGEVVCGNHTGADIVIPESRIRREQHFPVRNYFRLKVRGRKGTIDVLDPHEVEVDGLPARATYEDVDGHRFDVLRRDEAGDRDYVVSLRLAEDSRLPDPRARLLSIDAEDRITAPLFTRGLPYGASRTLELGDLRATFTFDGARARIGEYLGTYRQGEGFRPFLVQRGTDRFRTAPEDGATFDVQAGDRLIVGSAVYLVRNE